MPQLAILGCISGFLTALTAVAFRLSFKLALEYLLPGESESFEQLPVAARFLLPVIGALIIGLTMHRTKPEHHSVGVGHVLEHIQHHQTQLPAANGLIQFIGGAIALLTGNSVGREGQALFISPSAAPLMSEIAGIITKQDIDNYYQ
jgi:CIC family chloride channel protein